MKRYLLTTTVASKWLLSENDGKYGVISLDTLNPEFNRPKENPWPILKPEDWPPLVGQVVVLRSPWLHGPTDHPDRFGTGLYTTSKIKTVEAEEVSE